MVSCAQHHSIPSHAILDGKLGEVSMSILTGFSLPQAHPLLYLSAAAASDMSPLRGESLTWLHGWRHGTAICVPDWPMTQQ